MNDLIRPTLYEAFHRIEPVGQPQPVLGLADIVGPVCETTDKFLSVKGFYNLKEKEYVAIADVGAYGMSLSSNYNIRLLQANFTFSGTFYFTPY